MIHLKVDKLLLFHDVPELFTAIDQVDGKYLCLRIDTDSAYCEYIAIRISSKKLEAILSGIVDIRDAFLAPEEECWYSITSNETQDFIVAPCDFQAIPEDYLPDEGLFIVDPIKEYQLITERKELVREEVLSHKLYSVDNVSNQHNGGINMTWSNFIHGVHNGNGGGVNERLGVIELARHFFERHEHFHEIPSAERKFIAGLPNHSQHPDAADWGCFGAMNGNGIFSGLINANNMAISEALDKIPLHGPITEAHYNEYKDKYQKAFVGTRLENANVISTATRLLAMKRPDTFICVTNANRINLRVSLGIRGMTIKLDTYWERIIRKILTMDFYLHPNPKGDIETRISRARVAFLDSIYRNP